MKKTFLILLTLLMVITSSLAYGETTEKEHTFLTFEGKDGTVYNLFVITKMNFGDDHKVNSVTGHFERVVNGEEYESSETAPDSEVTYPLAENFSAEMVGSAVEMDRFVTVSDLYEWYIDAYIGRDDYDGHEWVFSCDQTQEEQEMGTADFWFVTTKIELNDASEIQFMQYEFVSWA